MRAFDNGCFFTVLCSEFDVSAFADRWPCFGKRRSLWFQFDKRNGDLVDTNQVDGEQDGAGVVALADDAKAYGIRRLKLRALAA